jgi:tRNA A-37 threonylcarbamoyl transferase component Bud32
MPSRLFQTQSFHAEPAVCALFEPGGVLADGQVWQSEATKVVRLPVTADQGCYLKRCGRESLKHLLRPLLFFRRPCSMAMRELLMLQALRQAGFPAMEPLAWGERRVLGIPVSGFLVVNEVRGELADRLLSTLAGDQRESLLKEVGTLLGRLHAAGFYQPVRLKDLIRAEQGLVLIDRETSKPWRGVFARRWCLESLRRSIRKSISDGSALTHPDLEALASGYSSAIADRWRVRPDELLTKTGNPGPGRS